MFYIKVSKNIKKKRFQDGYIFITNKLKYRLIYFN